MSDMKRCAHCGGQSPADAVYCIECGRPIVEAATGPTRRLEQPLPRPRVAARPAAPAPTFSPAPVYRPAPQAPRSPAQQGGDLTVPFLIIGAALAFLLVPRFGPMVLVAIGLVGLFARGLLARPDRVLPLLVFAGIMAVLFTGGKLFWPVLVGFFILRAICGGHRCW